MPTIEVVSIGCEAVPALPEFSVFDYEAETSVHSHRSLFYDFYKGVKGGIVHLFDKDCEIRSSAGSIVEWDPEGFIVIGGSEEDQDGAYRDGELFFRAEVVPELRQLMELMLDSSPTWEIYFSTDYQFGPREAWRMPGYSFSSFWEEHEAKGLRFNSLYHIEGK
jgi:hypothetical protein